jgi:hypothetical protein
VRGARWWLAASLWLAAAPARGQPAGAREVERAKSYFNAGAEAYDAGQYLAAIQAFERAQRLAPRPAILFSLGQAERRQFAVDGSVEHLRAAVGHFRAYLEQVPQGGRRADAAAALAELEPQVPRAQAPPPPPPERRPTRVLVTSSPKGALVSLDGAPPAPATLVREVAPGRHAVLVRAAGYFDERDEVTAVESDLVALHVTLRPRPGQLSFRVPGGSRLFLDGRELGGAPLAGPVEVEPGAHVVAVTGPGRRAVAREVVVGRGEWHTFAASPPATGQRLVALGLLGVGAAGLVAGGAGAGVALGHERAARGVAERGEGRALTTAERDRYNDALGARDAWARAAVVTGGAGAVLAVAGGLLYTFDHPAPVVPLAPNSPSGRDGGRPAAPGRLSARAFVGARAAGAIVGGEF